MAWRQRHPSQQWPEDVVDVVAPSVPPPRSENGGAQQIDTLEGLRAATVGNSTVSQKEECPEGIAGLAGGHHIVKQITVFTDCKT